MRETAPYVQGYSTVLWKLELQAVTNSAEPWGRAARGACCTVCSVEGQPQATTQALMTELYLAGCLAPWPWVHWSLGSISSEERQMRTWSDTRPAATGGKPRVDAHLSADQRQAQPKSRSSGEPVGIVPAWSVRPASQFSPAPSPGVHSLCAHTHKNGRHNDNARANERLVAPGAAGFGDGVLESPGTLDACSLHSARQGWRSPISPSSPVNLLLLFSRRPDRQSPPAAGLHRNGALQQKQATRGPFSLRARAARPLPLVRTVAGPPPPPVWALWPHVHDGQGYFCAWPRHGHRVEKSHAAHTRGGPATPATSSIKERQPHCSRVALRQNIFGR